MIATPCKEINVKNIYLHHVKMADILKPFLSNKNQWPNENSQVLKYNLLQMAS